MRSSGLVRPNDVWRPGEQLVLRTHDGTGNLRAHPVLLLASHRAGNVTGADFVIDGGLVATL